MKNYRRIDINHLTIKSMWGEAKYWRNTDRKHNSRDAQWEENVCWGWIQKEQQGGKGKRYQFITDIKNNGKLLQHKGGWKEQGNWKKKNIFHSYINDDTVPREIIHTEF